MTESHLAGRLSRRRLAGVMVHCQVTLFKKLQDITKMKNRLESLNFANTFANTYAFIGIHTRRSRWYNDDRSSLTLVNLI